MSGLRRWATSLAIVLLVHALLIGVACWWAACAPAVATVAAPAALMLELAPMAQAPPVPRREVATGPLQQQQQRQAPKPALREQPKAPVQPQGDLPRTPEPAPSPDTADANVAQTSAPPQVAADAAARYTAPQTTAGERSRAEATWEGRLLGHLQKHRRYPRQAERLRQQGVVYVRFAVARDGAVSGLKLGRGSGFELLDQETLDTVQRASPVPAPPAEVAGDPVEVMVPVSFFLRGR
ncbi:energy transducer TonB [Stenotrophomonas maltophilia]|uniref:energy transducer TonB n=1 Tax=Stenotrophomonas maltophilia TaxID=40324 RepID=UPI0025ECB20E|nr:energy transducer TonB [uncultured Stenotrophomonas sp.]HDS1662424.1 energy transducer TonB [Stenotrophomonas maltophilia]